jgi:hypothetical protein
MSCQLFITIYCIFQMSGSPESRCRTHWTRRLWLIWCWTTRKCPQSREINATLRAIGSVSGRLIIHLKIIYFAAEVVEGYVPAECQLRPYQNELVTQAIKFVTIVEKSNKLASKIIQRKEHYYLRSNGQWQNANSRSRHPQAFDAETLGGQSWPSKW